MSRFYGTVREVGSDRTAGTRCGHKNIAASAQTYEGSLIAIAETNRDGDTVFRLEVDEEDSAMRGREIFAGTLQELISKLSA